MDAVGALAITWQVIEAYNQALAGVRARSGGRASAGKGMEPSNPESVFCPELAAILLPFVSKTLGPSCPEASS